MYPLYANEQIIVPPATTNALRFKCKHILGDAKKLQEKESGQRPVSRIPNAFNIWMLARIPARRAFRACEISLAPRTPRWICQILRLSRAHHAGITLHRLAERSYNVTWRDNGPCAVLMVKYCPSFAF